jgi:hypothetical protein
METCNPINIGCRSRTCLICESPLIYYVNYSKYHGVCENHKNDLNVILKCNWCKRFIKVYFYEEVVTCDVCSQEKLCMSLQCRHKFCRNCSPSDFCRVCYKICDECNLQTPVLVKPCKHCYCQNCAPIGNYCSVCEPRFCENCKSKISSNFDDCDKCYGKCYMCNHKGFITSFDCTHQLCNRCTGGTVFYCNLCSQSVCKKCRNDMKKLKKCNKHAVCFRCLNIYWQNECLECNGRDKYKCIKCNSVGEIRKCSQGNHQFCLKCFNNICEICTHPCCICCNSFRGDLLKIHKCGHLICDNCNSSGNQNTCHLCRDLIFCKSCGEPANWIENGKLKKKCSNCKKQICLGCGTVIYFFSNHVCPIKPIEPNNTNLV